MIVESMYCNTLKVFLRNRGYRGNKIPGANQNQLGLGPTTLSHEKPTHSLGSLQDTGRRPPQRKRTMQIGTWNVRTLFRSGAWASLSSELLKYRMDVTALQEVRWKGTDTIKTKHHTIFYSGHEQNTLGTAFVVNNKI